MRFQDIPFQTIPSDSIRKGGKSARVHFPNGYGASIVCHDGSYGGDQGLFEVAVLRGDSIAYDTPVTSDVIGWLNPGDVESVLKQIETLR